MVAVCAVMTALLLAVQCALSFVAGVELVTAFLLVFCYVFGAKYGMVTATAFSLLRNFIFGFAPDVIVLYLIYFNAFALLFGAMGKRRSRIAEYVCPALVLLLAAGALALFGRQVAHRAGSRCSCVACSILHGVFYAFKRCYHAAFLRLEHGCRDRLFLHGFFRNGTADTVRCGERHAFILSA